MNTEIIDISKIKQPIIAYYNEMQDNVIAKIYYPNQEQYDSLRADWIVRDHGADWWGVTISRRAETKQEVFELGLISWQYI